MGWRFRIANFIMGDYLRNYLLVGIRLPISNIVKYEDDLDSFTVKKLTQIIKDIDELVKM